MKRLTITLLLLWSLLGCSGGEPTIPDRPAFDDAVVAYLARRGMELKIVKYKAFTLSDDRLTAEAEIRLGYVDPMVKATKGFVFEFEQVDGEWQVTTHRFK